MWWEKRTKTAVTKEWVERAVAWTDEQARKFDKGLIAIGPGTPAEKLQYAKQYLKDLAPPAITALKDIELEKLIEAGVNLLRRQKPQPAADVVPPIVP